MSDEQRTINAKAAVNLYNCMYGDKSPSIMDSFLDNSSFGTLY